MQELLHPNSMEPELEPITATPTKPMNNAESEHSEGATPASDKHRRSPPQNNTNNSQDSDHKMNGEKSPSNSSQHRHSSRSLEAVVNEIKGKNYCGSKLEASLRNNGAQCQSVSRKNSAQQTANYDKDERHIGATPNNSDDLSLPDNIDEMNVNKNNNNNNNHNNGDDVAPGVDGDEDADENDDKNDENEIDNEIDNEPDNDTDNEPQFGGSSQIFDFLNQLIAAYSSQNIGANDNNSVSNSSLTSLAALLTSPSMAATSGLNAAVPSLRSMFGASSTPSTLPTLPLTMSNMIPSTVAAPPPAMSNGNDLLLALASLSQASNLFPQNNGNILSALSGDAGPVASENQNPSESVLSIADNNDSNNTIYRGLYPIKDVKEYFTRTVNAENEKVYSCKFPGCTFQTKQYSQHISRHIYLKHIGIKKELRCRQCDKKFQRPESLVQHEKNHVCGFGIDQDRMNDPNNPCGKINIKKHFKKVSDHEFDVYQCQFGNCKFHTNNSGSIRRHVHNQHICAYGSLNNNHPLSSSAVTASSASPVPSTSTAANHGHSNQYTGLYNATASALNNHGSSISAASGSAAVTSVSNNSPSTGMSRFSQNILRNLAAGHDAWPEVHCQLVVGEQDYRPEACDEFSRPPSQIGARSDEDDDGPMNLAQPDCPIRNPIDQQQFDENSPEDLNDKDSRSTPNPQDLFQMDMDASLSSSFPNLASIAGSPSQSTNSGSANKKNNGLYSLKNYKQFYTKKKSKDGPGYVFVCSICNKFEANQQISLIRHIWTETEHSHFACEFEGCDELFSSEFARYRHRKTVHQQGQNPPASNSRNANDNSGILDACPDFTNRASSSSGHSRANNFLSGDKRNFIKQEAEAQKKMQRFNEQPKNDSTDNSLQMQLLAEMLKKQDPSSASLLQYLNMKQANDADLRSVVPPFGMSRSQPHQSNELITKLLNAPTGSLTSNFDLDSFSESSSEPPSKRSRASPKNDVFTNDSLNLKSTSHTDLDFLKSTLENSPPTTSTVKTEPDTNAQAKSKNPAKSGLYSLKIHQDKYIRKKKETGNGYEYSCKTENCQYSTSSQASMVRHIWSHEHQEFSCNVCEQKFENEFNLYKHKKSLHPEATTQHNRGVKGASKKQQAQLLKKQQQQQQQQQQQSYLQMSQKSSNSQQLLPKLLQQLNPQQAMEMSRGQNCSRSLLASEESLLNPTLPLMSGGFPTLPETGLGNISPELLIQLMTLVQRLQQQNTEGGTLPTQQGLESVLFPSNNDTSNNEISMREMSNNDDDTNSGEFESYDDTDRSHASGIQPVSEPGASGMEDYSALTLEWYRAAYAATLNANTSATTVNASSTLPTSLSSTSSGNHVKNNHNVYNNSTVPGVSRRALLFKQKKKHENLPGKFRTIEEQRQGDHASPGHDDGDDEQNDDDIDEAFDDVEDDDEPTLNGPQMNVINSNFHSEADTEEDEDNEDFNNNNSQQLSALIGDCPGNNRPSNGRFTRVSRPTNWNKNSSNEFNHRNSSNNGAANNGLSPFQQSLKNHFNGIIDGAKQQQQNATQQQNFESDTSDNDLEIDEDQD